MKRFCMMLLLLGNATFLFAQSNYKPGYIVKTVGDTTRGMVNYREWEQSPQEISFKASSGDKPSILTLADISAFGVNNAEYYERFTLRISQDDANPTTVGSKAVDTSNKTATVFAKVIAKGKYLNLYSYTDALKSRFYLSTVSGETPAELGYHIKPMVGDNTGRSGVNSSVISGDGNYSYTIKEPYKQQLTIIAQKAGILTSKLAFKIEHMRYNERELLAVFNKINGGGSALFHTETLPGSRFFIGAGADIGKFEFGGEGTFPPTLHLTNTSPAVLTGIDVFVNKYTKKVYFRAQLGYTAHQYGYQDAPSKTNPDVKSSLNFKQNIVTVSLLPGFNFYNTPRIRAFFNAGGGASMARYDKYKYIENFYEVSQREQINYPDFSKVWFTAQANIGVEIAGKIALTAGCSTYSRIVNVGNITASVASYHAGLIYIFGKK